MTAVLLSQRGVGLVELPEPYPIYKHPKKPDFHPFRWDLRTAAYERNFRTYWRLTAYPRMVELWFYEEC